MFSFIFGLLSALAALTFGTRPRKPAPPGNLRMTITPVTFPTKYTEGGEAITPSDVGLTTVDYGFAVLKDPTAGEGTVNIANVWYDWENEKLKLYDETPAEVADEAEVKEPTALVYAFGS